MSMSTLNCQIRMGVLKSNANMLLISVLLNGCIDSHHNNLIFDSLIVSCPN
jgi:hypothetical protein